MTNDIGKRRWNSGCLNRKERCIWGITAALLVGSLTACGTAAPEEGESGVGILSEISDGNGAAAGSPEGSGTEDTGAEEIRESGQSSEGNSGVSGIPAGLITEQSFETELDGWGKVTFGAFEPLEYLSENPDYGQTMFGDARFMLFSEDGVLYTFPGETEDNILSGFTQLKEVLSVAFKDYNEDGRTDILLLLEYTGFDGGSFRRVRVYTQREGEKEFEIDKPLSEYLGQYTENMSQVYEGINDYSRSYSVCTNISAWEIERFARRVREQILEGDYESLADECGYPVMVNGVAYESKEALLAANLLQNPGQPFLDAVREETGEQMFHSWQGIMLGNGEVWFSEVLNEDMSSWGLKITALNNVASAQSVLSWEETEALISERIPYYQASAYHDEIVTYWERVRGVTDVSNVIEPLYETDKQYLTKENLAYDPPVVIHLAKNEIYARHGYIFRDEDLYNYFMGCIWYTPTVEPEDFSAEVLNEYEKANLELLKELDTL